ncbi:MAG: adenylate/guanylate cyclase [Myxococcaceae bacterium]|nr:adenylate/guanylate cyclase [Myxococcaceae bacterium]
MPSGMHRFTAKFDDPRLEALYQQDIFERVRLFTRFSLTIATVVYLAYGVHDALVVPAVHQLAWALRYGLFGPVGLAVIAFSYSRWYERFHQPAMLLFGLSTNIVVIFIGAAEAPAAGFFIYTSYSVLFVVLGPFLSKMNVATQSFYTLSTCVLFMVVERTMVHGPTEIFLSIATTILAVGGIGAIAAWQLEVQSREAFLARGIIRDQYKALDLEKGKSDALLLNILPAAVAERLKEDGESIADGFAQVTVLFSDIVGFTKMSDRLTPAELVRRLNAIFSAFDALADRFGVEKIKTIGDAYMVAGGLPDHKADHAEAIAEMALEMRTALENLKSVLGEAISIRIGIHTGPVVAGVIGKKKFIYDIWGDTVNTASRMESHALPGTIQVSEDTFKLLSSKFALTARGEIDVKGKGPMKTWFLEGRR